MYPNRGEERCTRVADIDHLRRGPPPPSPYTHTHIYMRRALTVFPEGSTSAASYRESSMHRLPIPSSSSSAAAAGGAGGAGGKGQQQVGGGWHV